MNGPYESTTNEERYETVVCGGCQQRGAHKRWCPEKYGIRAYLLGETADKLEDAADRIGAIDPDLANDLYGISARTRQRANMARKVPR